MGQGGLFQQGLDQVHEALGLVGSGILLSRFMVGCADFGAQGRITQELVDSSA